MKIFVEEFDVKNSEPDICRFLESIIESDEFDKETVVFFTKGYRKKSHTYYQNDL